MSGSRPSSFALTRPGSVRLYSTAELITMPLPTWQIDGILPMGGLVGLYAPPGVGKTFLSIDMALSIATGRPWQGHDVTQGFVLYISAEGGTGIGKRVAAWLQEYDVKATKADVAWLTEAIPITPASDGMDRLIERIDVEVDRYPKLIVIDTLARCFDGDENQQKDMGQFVQGVDLLRTYFNATVLIVHHTRLDATRERGNTSFRGAADAMFQMKREEGKIVFSCNKQKDAEEFGDMLFDLKTVDDKESCVLVRPLSNRAQLVHEKAEAILRILEEHKELTFTQWLGLTSPLKVSDASFKRALKDFREKHEILKENHTYRRNPEKTKAHEIKKNRTREPSLTD